MGNTSVSRAAFPQALPLALLFFLGACATPDNPAITVYTSPAAATVTHSGMSQSSPATFYFQRPAGDACWNVSGFTARWLSGATASTGPSVQLCGRSAFYEITIERPQDAPGLDYDIQAAYDQQQRQSENSRTLGETLGRAAGASIR
jgi:hypothetical protein